MAEHSSQGNQLPQLPSTVKQKIVKPYAVRNKHHRQKRLSMRFPNVLAQISLGASANTSNRIEHLDTKHETETVKCFGLIPCFVEFDHFISLLSNSLGVEVLCPSQHF